MANHLRRQIREAVASALGNLTTSGARVYESRTHEMQDANLPGLRIYTNNEEVGVEETIGPSRSVGRDLELVVEACSKKTTGLDDELDAMIQEVEVALAANQGLGVGAKSVELQRIEIDMVGEAEKEVGVARMTFQVRYITAIGTPDVAQ